MILLAIRDIGKHYGPEPVLDGVTFAVRPGDRIGLVGPNGTGKTTLLRILAGREEADRGHVERHPTARLSFLEQQQELDRDRTVWEEAARALEHLEAMVREAERLAHAISTVEQTPERIRLEQRYDRLHHELQRLDGYHLDHKIAQVLTGLGFDASAFQQQACSLSGGQQNRLHLAKLLLKNADLLLLDEPSNHLDMEATQWLEDYLVATKQTLIVVSHDRYFLDRVTNRTLELFHGTVDDYVGNFSAYRRQKAERLEVQRRTYEKQQVEIAKMEEFVRRHHYGQKHAQAEDRRKRLERLERIAEPRAIQVPAMAFAEASRTGDIVLRVEHLAKRFDQPLFEDLSLDILRGEKWAVMGPNGSGKTTLVRCLLGELEPDQGQVIRGAGVKIGYFDQHLHCLADDAPVVDAVRPEHKELFEGPRRNLLARFGITGDLVFQRVDELSGGERNRAALALLAAEDANLLVLDEPTNHLDLWAREALQAALRGFPGTVFLVSHDRYFLNRVADHLLVIQPGKCTAIEGNYDTYRHLIERGYGAPRPITEPGDRADARKSGRRDARTPAARRKRKFPYRKVVEIEADIQQCERRIEQLHHQLSDPEFLREGEQIKRATAELERCRQHLEHLYDHWEEASELN